MYESSKIRLSVYVSILSIVVNATCKIYREFQGFEQK